MKTLLIGNCIYLPIDKDIDDKSKRKYIAGDMNGNIYMNQIYTIEEIEEKHKNSSYSLEHCNGIEGIVEKY